MGRQTYFPAICWFESDLVFSSPPWEVVTCPFDSGDKVDHRGLQAEFHFTLGSLARVPKEFTKQWGRGRGTAFQAEGTAEGDLGTA